MQQVMSANAPVWEQTTGRMTMAVGFQQMMRLQPVGVTASLHVD